MLQGVLIPYRRHGQVLLVVVLIAWDGFNLEVVDDLLHFRNSARKCFPIECLQGLDPVVNLNGLLLDLALDLVDLALDGLD